MLRHRVEVPSRKAESASMPMVVMMHGRGADMNDLADLAPLLDPTGGARFVFPNAPRAWEMQPGMSFGWTWFDGWPPEQKSVAASREVLLQFLDEITAKYPTTSLVIAGFSQGAMMSLDVGLRREAAGIIAMSGGLYELDLPETLHKAPVFLAHGSADDVVPVSYARRARMLLEERGFDVEYHEYPMGHQVAMEEAQAVKAFLERVATPSS
ncbi:MAG TPA: carboxylesterase [Thermoanaerobaculia bacterium]|nr:carboxylesterase [Thermoanaerobaculia bacterium]